MRLRTKFLLVIGILHLLVLGLSFSIFEDKVLFFVAELGVLVSLAISWQLYKQMLQPLQTVVNGIEAIRDKDFNVKFLPTGTYEMDQLIDVYNQMMEQLKTERIRQEQQHFFLEKLIQTSPIGILILDFDGMVKQVNAKACTIFGMTDKQLLKQPIDSIDHPLLNKIGLLDSGEAKTLSLDGVHTFKLQRSHFIDRGFARSFVMVEELTEEILAAEKKAYGKVIRMMAHEVNNTIGPVNSIIDSALETKELWTPAYKNLAHALRVAFDRNQSLNIFMRNFADVVRLPPPNKSGVDLRQLLTHVATLFEYNTKAAHIQLQIQIPDSPIVIQADPQQMEQALINIIKNAMESIKQDGEIILAYDPNLLQLSITDSGPGINEAQAVNLFSPFFSTKKDGQGVGLTLVKEILLNHGFLFSLKTVAAFKTVFLIEFNES